MIEGERGGKYKIELARHVVTRPDRVLIERDGHDIMRAAHGRARAVPVQDVMDELPMH